MLQLHTQKPTAAELNSPNSRTYLLSMGIIPVGNLYIRRLDYTRQFLTQPPDGEDQTGRETFFIQ